MEDRLIQLRDKAEKLLNENLSQRTEIPLSEFNKVVHDLKVYQIELELQNEELRSTQKQHEDSRNKYAQLFNQAPAGYVTLNQKSIVLQANQTFAKMVNRDLDHIVNSSFANFVDISDRSIFLSRYNAFFKNPAEKNMELRIEKKGGKPFFARISGNLKTDDAFENKQDLLQPKLFLIITDITREKNAEKRLVESENNFRSLADSGQALIHTSGTDRLSNYFNKVWLSFTGRAEEIELDNGWLAGIHPEDYEKCMQIFDTAFDNRQNYSLEYRLKRHDGEYRWLQDDGCPRYNSDGVFIGYIGYCLDITESKQIGFTLKTTNEELFKLNSQKDKFFSIIAHDLRGPFNGFLGLTEIMANQLNTLSLNDLLSISVSLNNSANNLFNLLNNLLEWARMQQGILIFNPASILLLPFVTSTVQPIMELANKKGVGISLHIPDNLQVFADPNMLSSTIRNLASNAVKFTPAGGQVSLKAATIADGHTEFSVKDTGIGMDSETLANMFKLDVSISRKGTDGEPSTGLGLLLCKDFIEKHGGMIWVDSEEGKGSTFCFTLPVEGSRGRL
jgi:two-component system CheB/CheR fusion protein